MKERSIHILNAFDLHTIPDLDVAVFGALELFQKERLPQLDLKNVYTRPLVVGSGNAEATGRIIFQDIDAIFASESDYEEKLKRFRSIDGVVLISASGEKHAPIIAKTAKRHQKHITLITNSRNSSASKELDHLHPHDEFIFPKNREPYTYNVSTYMGMMLGHTGEDSSRIYRFIQEEVAAVKFPDLSQYDKFFFIIPPRFSGIVRMLHLKFIELFGRNIARDIETTEFITRHVVAVAPSRELFVSFGDKNVLWGDPSRRLHIPLPQDAGYAAMMAIGYYAIAQIQKTHPPYFKENILKYTKKISKLYTQPILPIVE